MASGAGAVLRPRQPVAVVDIDIDIDIDIDVTPG